ncbi:hypothetical protein OEZ85_002248 [Tetradesmus obliquus]|uniref:Pex N-terminal domain-containing protein n=1 Tax=Tetradesmus obliquus TaxID=3088 RepID=A0ABY8U594_TETOB|nr:hypothetical protein OEZ85_002248 [Tetradesmus obliquus]
MSNRPSSVCQQLLSAEQRAAARLQQVLARALVPLNLHQLATIRASVRAAALRLVMITLHKLAQPGSGVTWLDVMTATRAILTLPNAPDAATGQQQSLAAAPGGALTSPGLSAGKQQKLVTYAVRNLQLLSGSGIYTVDLLVVPHANFDLVLGNEILYLYAVRTWARDFRQAGRYLLLPLLVSLWRQVYRPRAALPALASTEPGRPLDPSTVEVTTEHGLTAAAPSAAAAAAAAAAEGLGFLERDCCACTAGNRNKASLAARQLSASDTVERFDVALFCASHGASGTGIRTGVGSV